MRIIISVGTGSLFWASPAFGTNSSGGPDLDLELRHPKGQAYWYQKAGLSSVYFYWRQKGTKHLKKTLEIAQDCSFSKEMLLFKISLTSAPYRWNTSYTGQICWHIAMYDEQGAEIYKSEDRQLLIVPDRLLVNEMQIEADRTLISWHLESKPLFFRFKLSQDREFLRPLVNVDQEADYYTLTNLPPGVYFWKVGVKYS